MPTSLTFWREEGESSLHWFDAESRAWLSRARGSQRWRGWKADCSDCVETTERAHWVPWPGGVCDESEAPFVRWYCGGLTNAAFNEVCSALPRASACLAALSAVPKRAFGDCGAARPPRYRRSRARDRVRLRAGRGRTAFAHRQARAAHSLGGRSGDAPRRPRPLRWATRRHRAPQPSGGGRVDQRVQTARADLRRNRSGNLLRRPCGPPR